VTEYELSESWLVSRLTQPLASLPSWGVSGPGFVGARCLSFAVVQAVRVGAW